MLSRVPRLFRASPRLKDADIPESACADLYVELMLMTRKMFVECRLVHADLSEYNILYHVDDADDPRPEPTSSASEPAPGVPGEPSTSAPAAPRRGHLHIIDVSQSVEHDHPHAFDFLRADLRNVEDFFARRGVRTVGLRRAFEFVTRADAPSSPASSDAEALLRGWMDAPEPPAAEEGAPLNSGNGDGEGHGASTETTRAHEDAVFMRSYIPRTLNEVFDPERDVGVLSRGDGAQLIYKDTIGIVGPGERSAGAEGSAAAHADGAPRRKTVAFADQKAGGHGRDREDEGASAGAEREVEEGVDEDEDGEDTDGEGEDEEDSGDENGDGGFQEKKPRGHRHEDKEAKKVGRRDACTEIGVADRAGCCRSARRPRRRRRARNASTRSRRRRRSARSKRQRAEDRLWLFGCAYRHERSASVRSG